MLTRARLYAREGRWDGEALSLNTQILERSPGRVGAYIRRSRCYMEKGMLAEAERDLHTALTKDPKNEELKSLLCRLETSKSSTMDGAVGAPQEASHASVIVAPVGLAPLPHLPVPPRSSSGAHSVYVVELDPAVLRRRKFLAENPGYVPGMPCVYVGLTGLTPEERLENHRTGYKASRYVRDFGKGLLPELYEYLNPMPYDVAGRMENELARALREAGYAVWSY